VGTIADISDYINRATGGASGTPEVLHFSKTDRINGAGVTGGAGRWISLNMMDGCPSGTGGTALGAASVPTNVSDGTLRHANASGGRTKWLTGVTASCITPGTLLIYDRLGEQGGLSGALATTQTTNLPTSPLTRSTSGLGVQIFLEIHTTIGASGANVTVDYKNEDGVSKTSPVVALGAGTQREQGRLIPVALSAGDLGVTSVEAVKLSISTGTAGSFGVVLAKPLLYLPLQIAGVGENRNLLSGFGPIEIPENAALSMAFFGSSSTIPAPVGTLSFVEA